MLTITSCASCDAGIFWAITDKDKLIPIDVDPVEGGNLRLTSVDPRPHVTKAKEPELFGGDDGTRYRAHFVTCPHADWWRGGRPRSANTPGPKRWRTMHR